MKDEFPGFYAPPDQDIDKAWTEPGTLFVFDTSVLTHLYHYSQDTADEMLKVLATLGNRAWLPHHAALEFQRNRLEVIAQEKRFFGEVNSKLDEISKLLKASNWSGLDTSKRHTELHEELQKYLNETRSATTAIKRTVKEIKDSEPDVFKEDKIRGELDQLFNGRIGTPFSQDEIASIEAEGEVRYRASIPPGFEDAEKTGRFQFGGVHTQNKYGDLIIWKETIRKARAENRRAVIFVTDDFKEDWWEIVQSENEHWIGPRPELRQEIRGEAGTKTFCMYTVTSFLKKARESLKVTVSESSLEETEEPVEAEKSRRRELQRAAEGFMSSDALRTKLSERLPPETKELVDKLSESRNMRPGALISEVMQQQLDSINSEKQWLEERLPTKPAVEEAYRKMIEGQERSFEAFSSRNKTDQNGPEDD